MKRTFDCKTSLKPNLSTLDTREAILQLGVEFNNSVLSRLAWT